MEEMLAVMIRAALEGYRVRFQFHLPYPVLEAPGAQVDGRVAAWEIPLKGIIDPENPDTYDRFQMIMKTP
jgi:hypothetical protein